MYNTQLLCSFFADNPNALSEIGILYGQTKENMQVLDSYVFDEHWMGYPPRPNLTYGYSFAGVESPSFYYQAYAYINGELYKGEVKHFPQ